MNKTFHRYSPNMLDALSKQSIPSLIRNAALRGVVFTIVIQLLTVASGYPLGSLIQIILLAVVFSIFVLSFDVLEKYWAQNRLNKN